MAAEWQKLGDAYYRRTIQYELGWSVQRLDEFLVASSADMGWIALTRDPEQLVALGDTSAMEPKIQVYTGAGQLFETLPWDAHARIVGLGFTWRDELVVVADDGHVRLYSWLVPYHHPQQHSGGMSCIEATPTSYYQVHTLGQEATELGVAGVLIEPKHIWALLRNGSLIDAPLTSDDMSVWSEMPLTIDTHVLPPLSTPRPSLYAWTPFTRHGDARLFLSTDTSAWSVHRFDGYAKEAYEDGPMCAVSFSPNGKLVAWINERQELIVDTVGPSRRRLRTWDITSAHAYQVAPLAFRTRKLLEDADLVATPTDKGGFAASGVHAMTWCGDNAVALAICDHVLLVGPHGEPMDFPVRGIPYLFGSHDGLHIVHRDAHEHIGKVEAPTLRALRPGSTHMAAILLDASRLAQRHCSQAYEAVRTIQHELTSAVDTCIEAATYEWHVDTQTALLQAALFGKTFIDTYEPTRFLHVARLMRVLNAVRTPWIGIPASFDETHVPNLLYRLASRGQHKLAVRMCEHMGVRPDAVLKHWARAKVARAHPVGLHGDTARDERLAHLIIDKFQTAGTLRYADIAMNAWHAGHPRIATLLLEKEVRACDQIPLLMHMQEHRLALMKAVESGDTDLILHVILALQSSLARGAFFRVVQSLDWPSLPPPSQDAQKVAAAAAATTTTTSSSSASATAVKVEPTDVVGLRPTSLPTYTTLAPRLLVSYGRDYDRPLAHDFFYQDDRHADMALLCIEDALQMDASVRADALRRAQRHFGEDRTCASEARLTDETCSLLGVQVAIQAELNIADTTGRPPSQVQGMSLFDTILTCLKHPKLEKRAEKLKHDFHVPEARYYALRVRAYIATQDFHSLWRHVMSRRPPHGYVTIVQALVHAGHVDEASRYMNRGVTMDKANRTKLMYVCENGGQKHGGN